MTTRGGELVAIVGPICDNLNCTGCTGSADLDACQLLDAATLAGRPDITTTELETAAAGYLHATGWTDLDPQLAAELATDMAEQAATVASWYAPGTRLKATFDRTDDTWTFQVAN